MTGFKGIAFALVKYFAVLIVGSVVGYVALDAAVNYLASL